VTRGRLTKLTLTVAAAAALAVFGLPRARLWGEARLRRALEKRASALCGAPVRIGHLELEFVPAGIHLDSIQVERRGNRGSEASGSAGRATIRAPIMTFLGATRGPVTVKVERPSIRIVLAEGRPFDLSSWFGGETDGAGPPPGGAGPAAALAAVPAGSTLAIQDGIVDIEITGGPRARLTGVRLDAFPGKAGGIEGRLAFEKGEYEGPGGAWPGLGGDATFAASPAEVRFDPLAIHADGLDLSGRATLRLDGAPVLDGTLDAGIGLDRLARFLPEGSAPAGQARVSLRGKVGGGQTEAHGDLEISNLGLWGVAVGTLRSDVVIDQGVHLRGIRAQLLGGEATGTADLTLAGPFAAETEMRIDGVDVAQVLEHAAWTGPPLTGTIHYNGRHHIGAGGIASLRGTGVLDAVGHYRSGRGADLPLEVTAGLVIEGSSLSLTNGSLRAGSTRAGFSGTVAPGEGIRLKLKGGTGDLTEIMPLFAPPARKPPRPAERPPGGKASSGRPAARPAAFPVPRPAPRFRTDALPAVLPATWPPRTPRPARFPRRPAGLSGGPAVQVAARPAAAPAAAPRAEPEEDGALVRITRLLGGRWEWDGDLGYGKGGVEFDGTLRGFDLTYRGAPIGALQARIKYHEDALVFEEGELRLDEASSVSLRGRIDFRGAGSVAVEASAANFPLEPALAAMGIKAPARGRLTGPVVITGRPDALAGRATIEAAPFAVAGVEFDRLQGELIFTPELLELRGVTLSLGQGTIAVAGRIPYLPGDWLPAEGEAPAGWTLEGHDLDLSRGTRAAATLGLRGTASLEGRIEGALSAPRGSIAIRAADVRAHGAPVGEVSARIGLEGRAARIDLQAPARGLSITGRIGLGDGEPSDLRAVLAGLELRGREIVPNAPEDARIVLSGEAQASGPLDSPERVEARAVFDRVEVSLAGMRLDARAPMEVTLHDGKLAVAPVAFAGEGTGIELRGMVDPGAGLIDLAASGGADLRLLRLFLKGLQANGTGQFAMKVGGPLAAPVFEGSLKAEADAIRHADLPFPISRLRAAAAFEGNRLKIETLEFLAGGGLVEGTGEVLLGDLERTESPFAIRRAAIRFLGSNVHAEYPDGLRSTSDVDVTLSREGGETLLSGTIDFIRSVYGKDFRLDKGKGPARAADVLRPGPGGPLAGVRLDLLIRAPQDAWLRNDFGAIEGQGELRVRGTAERPSLSGRITAVEGGTIRFRGVSYRVLAGSMDFADPEVIDPVYDLQAETHVSEYQVTLHAEGTMGDFRYDLSSNPPLPEQDIVSLLLTGRTLGSFGQEGGGLAEETISTYLTGRLTGELTDRVPGMGGIDLFSIDPLQANAQGDPTTRITVGKQVTPDLFVAYSSDMSSTEGAIYQLDYALSRDFHFASLRDRDGSIGGDFKYILRGKPPAVPGIVEPAAPPPLLGTIRIEGDLKTRETRVRRILRVREGRPRDRSAINQGIDRLLKRYRDQGYLMADADYDESPAADGRVDMTFHVKPGPRVAIDFEGIRGRAALRQEIEPFWRKGLFMEDIVEQAADRLQEVLKDRGYQKAAIASAVEQQDPEMVRVRFTVTRGPRTRASAVRIAGASRLAEKEVRRAIRTVPDGPFSRGLVRDGILAQDATAILALYHERGFPLARVPPPEVVLDEGGRTAEITFHVEEGPQVILGPPRFEGSGSFYPVLLERAAALKPGAPYTAESIDAALVGLRRLYDEHGYPDVRVGCRALAAEVSDYPVVERPVFDIEEGRHQRIGEVRIAGNVLTHDEVIRKALTIEPGTSLSRGDLQASQTRLYGRGVFRSVAIEPEPLPAGPLEGEALPEGHQGPPGIVDRDVVVTVRELPPLTQVFGLGFDTEEKLRGQYEISNRNIFGSGRYLGLQARASDVQRRGALSYREKGIFGGRHDLLASAFAEDESLPAFDVRTIGSSIQMSRRITRATRTQYRYSLKDVNLSDTTAAFEGSTLRLASLAASALHDTRDALFDPLRGHYLSGEVQFFGRGIGSEADFVKMYMQIYRFKQVFPRTVWAQALRAGACVPFGRSKDAPASTGDDLSGVPPSERFFAGGDTTLRGFARDRVGPHVDGDPVGGEGLFVFNEELRFPIFRMLGGVVFYDAGNVYRTLADYDVSDLRHVAGFGLRLATPIGPFRLEYGAILDREPDEPRGELFFSIGQAF